MLPLEGLGPALRLLRTRRPGGAWNQAQLAKASGVSGDTMNKIENGKRMPDTNTLNAILKAVGANVWQLAAALDEANGRCPPGAADGRVLDELVMRLEPAEALETKTSLLVLANAQGRGIPSADIEASCAEAARRMARRVLAVYGELNAVTKEGA